MVEGEILSLPYVRVLLVFWRCWSLQDKFCLHIFYGTVNKSWVLSVRFFLYCTYVCTIHIFIGYRLFTESIYMLTMNSKILLLLIFKVTLFGFYTFGGLTLACSQIHSLVFTPAPHLDSGRKLDRHWEIIYELIFKEKQTELERISPRHWQ